MKITQYFFASLLLTFCFTSAAWAFDTEKQLEIEPLADNLYQYRSYKHVDGYGLVSSNGLIVIHDKEALLIDTPWTDQHTAELVTWIENKQLTLTASISTHFHEDRSGGINLLNKKGIKTYATEATNQLLKKKSAALATNLLAPINDSLFYQQIETYYPGGGHSHDNIAIWLPAHQLLYGGCMVRSSSSKTLGNTADADVQAWPHSIEKLIHRYATAKMVLPGHGQMGDKSLLEHTKQLALTKRPVN